MHVYMQAVIGPPGADLTCSLKKLEGHKKSRRKQGNTTVHGCSNRVILTLPEAPSYLCVDERPYLEDVFKKNSNPQVVKVIENTKDKVELASGILN